MEVFFCRVKESNFNLLSSKLLTITQKSFLTWFCRRCKLFLSQERRKGEGNVLKQLYAKFVCIWCLCLLSVASSMKSNLKEQYWSAIPVSELLNKKTISRSYTILIRLYRSSFTEFYLYSLATIACFIWHRQIRGTESNSTDCHCFVHWQKGLGKKVNQLEISSCF